jgi:hypothetical protein
MYFCVVVSRDSRIFQKGLNVMNLPRKIFGNTNYLTTILMFAPSGYTYSV